jgi:hypothetical protein
MKPGWESWPWSCQCELLCMSVYGCESAVFTVCLVCFRRQAQILRRRYSSRSVQAVEFESVKTVDQSNRPKWFSGLRSFFPGLRSGLPQCGSVAWRRTEIKLSGGALESPWIDEIDEQPRHCLEIEMRAMHCAQSRACSSSALNRVDRRALMRTHDSAHCKKILAPVTRYERETRY